MDSTKETIIKILNTKFGIPQDVLIIDNFCKPLTGDVFRFSALNLTYLFFEIEKFYQIAIDEKYLLDYGFNSVDSIAEIISNCIEQV